MPVYDYQCAECGSTYDVYHKVREIVEDVVCPSCGSPKHKKLMSASAVSMGKSSSPAPSAPSCDSGCCGGACGLN